MEIRFPIYVHSEIGNNEELENRFRAVIDRLLEVYRYATEYFYVDLIPKRELHPYKVRTIREDGTVESERSVVNPGGGDVRLGQAQQYPFLTKLSRSYKKTPKSPPSLKFSI